MTTFFFWMGEVAFVAAPSLAPAVGVAGEDMGSRGIDWCMCYVALWKGFVKKRKDQSYQIVD